MNDGLNFVFHALMGVVAGITSGLFGLGGGTTIVPAMLAMGLSAHHAIGISVMQMVFASVFGSILNYKNRLLNLEDGLFLGIGGLIGASFSALVVDLLTDVQLSLCFLILSLYSFYRFVKKKSYTQVFSGSIPKSKKRMILIFSGMLTGIFAISLGIGGGLIIVPILVRYLGYDTKKATVLSLFFIVYSSLSGSYSFFSHGVIDLMVIQVGLVVGVFSMLGVSIGIWSMRLISATWHKRLLYIIYVISIVFTTLSIVKKL